MKDPLLKLATIFIQEHLFPVKALELRETDGSGNKNTTEEISLGVGLKKEYSKHFQFHVVRIVRRWWMPAVGHGKIK